MREKIQVRDIVSFGLYKKPYETLDAVGKKVADDFMFRVIDTIKEEKDAQKE